MFQNTLSNNWVVFHTYSWLTRDDLGQELLVAALIVFLVIVACITIIILRSIFAWKLLEGGELHDVDDVSDLDELKLIDFGRQIQTCTEPQ